MTIRTLMLAGLLAAACPPATLFAQENLPNDGRIEAERMPNGVIWLYRQHPNPAGKLTLMLHVRAGSLSERDAQRGMAHLAEHLCFQGTQNFTPEAMAGYAECAGMGLGPHKSAATGFDRTTYRLATAGIDEEQIERALMLLSDFAFRATIAEEPFQKERGVILEEARRPKPVQERVRDKLWAELFEGSGLARRVSGSDDTRIAEASRVNLLDFYRAWYRPENVTILVVGDAPSERVVPLIRKWFGEAKPDGEPAAAVSAELKPFRGQRSIVVTDPELTECQVQMITLRPGRPATTTVQAWRAEMVERIGAWILERRFETRRREAQAKHSTASASVSEFFNEVLMVSASLTGEAEGWRAMLEELLAEVNRAHAFGFQQAELDLAKRELIARAERAASAEGEQLAEQLLARMAEAVHDREPLPSPQQELSLYQQLLPGVELSEVDSVFHERFYPGTFAFVVTMPESPEASPPSPEEVLSVAKASLDARPEPRIERASPTPFLAGVPEPGKVAERSRDQDLDITHLTLGNGVRVHHRFMDHEDQVAVTISLAGGQIEESARNRGVTQVAALAVNDGGTSRLPSDRLRELVFEHGVRVFARPGGADDALTLQVTGAPRDLELGLQLAYALLTDGKIAEHVFESWSGRVLSNIERRREQPSVRAGEAVAEFVGGGDPRVGFLTASQVEALSIAEGQAWFERMSREAPMEVSVVGNIRLESLEPMLLRYVASLPQRKRTAEHLEALRTLKRRPGPFKKRLEVQTTKGEAYVISGFVGPDARKTDDDRALQLARRVLVGRLTTRLRDNLALTTTVNVQHMPSLAYRDSGRFETGAPCESDSAETLAREIKTIYDEFAETGPTDMELDSARREVLDAFDQAARQPTYWTSVLEQLDFRGGSLEDEKRYREALRKVGIEEVQSAFKKYYQPERAYEVVAIPVKPPAPPEPSEPEAEEPAPAEEDEPIP